MPPGAASIVDDDEPASLPLWTEPSVVPDGRLGSSPVHAAIRIQYARMIIGNTDTP